MEEIQSSCQNGATVKIEQQQLWPTAYQCVSVSIEATADDGDHLHAWAQFTPADARKLATLLIKAADDVQNQNLATAKAGD